MEGTWCIGDILSFLFSACLKRKVLNFDKEKVILGDVVGEGAYAYVYRAESTSTDAIYAVKMIFMHSEEFTRSAKQEVAAYNLFQHKNILKLLDHMVADTETDQKAMYLLFPFQHGGNLRQMLDNRISNPDKFPKLSLKKVFSGFKSICEAVNVLHTHEPPYVHQDIKPDNILFGDDGNLLLMDFNSVRLADVKINTRSDGLALADEAASFCTVSYRAPELFDPPRGNTIDARTDVWALGCLLYTWWFGYSPFECDFKGELGKPRVVECTQLKVLSDIPTPPYPSNDDKLVLEIVGWILDKDYSKRPYTSDILERVDDVIQMLITTEKKEKKGKKEKEEKKKRNQDEETVADTAVITTGGKV